MGGTFTELFSEGQGSGISCLIVSRADLSVMWDDKSTEIESNIKIYIYIKLCVGVGAGVEIMSYFNKNFNRDYYYCLRITSAGTTNKYKGLLYNLSSRGVRILGGGGPTG